MIRRVRRAARRVARKVAPGAAIVVDVATGTKPRDAVRRSAQERVRPVRRAIESAGELKARFDALSERLAREIGATRAHRLLRDFQRLASPLDIGHAESVAKGIEDFISTGDLNSLNPIYVLAGAEIRKARDEHRRQASAIPRSVASAMPAEISHEVASSKVIEMSSGVSRLSIPAFAVQHFKKAKAIVMIDVIFFERIPGYTNQEDLHFWAHEFWHVRQYKQWGLQAFVSKYLGNELGFRPRSRTVNPIEEEADQFACRHFPIARPKYIKSCRS